MNSKLIVIVVFFNLIQKGSRLVMKILISGATGLLGSVCTRILKKNHDIVALSSHELDITNAADVEASIQQIRPDIVLNCAAFTNVDECESERERAWSVNVDGPKNIALSVEKHGAWLIHISTDYVFDGEKVPPEPYVESDWPIPTTHYGKTKLEGERSIRRITEKHIILRTAWMYGIDGECFPKTILELALRNPGREIKVVNDQFGSPSWSYKFALQIKKLIEVNSQGTYHATSEGYCTWYDFANFFLQKMDIQHKILPCRSEEYPTPALRPKNSILQNLRLKKERINVMPHWKNQVEEFVDKYRQELINEAKHS